MVQSVSVAVPPRELYTHRPRVAIVNDGAVR